MLKSYPNSIMNKWGCKRRGQLLRELGYFSKASGGDGDIKQGSGDGDGDEGKH